MTYSIDMESIDFVSLGLLERRERKRAKRNIVNPKQKEPENVSPEASPKQRQQENDIDRPSKKKGKRGKVAPGVALMETFTAANLKSSRLTVNT